MDYVLIKNQNHMDTYLEEHEQIKAQMRNVQYAGITEEYVTVK